MSWQFYFLSSRPAHVLSRFTAFVLSRFAINGRRGFNIHAPKLRPQHSLNMDIFPVITISRHEELCQVYFSDVSMQTESCGELCSHAYGGEFTDTCPRLDHPAHWHGDPKAMTETPFLERGSINSSHSWSARISPWLLQRWSSCALYSTTPTAVAPLALRWFAIVRFVFIA